MAIKATNRPLGNPMRLIAVLTVLLFGAAAMAQEILPSDLNPAPPEPILKTAMFAGGCFWCMQPAFDGIPGVVGTRVGYTGGDVPDPTYEQVTSGKTGHLEAIEVTYDERRVKYEALLNIFWENVDPTDMDGQFADRGSQYRTAIFVVDTAQQQMAEASKAAIAQKLAPATTATAIAPANAFYPAEDYHQQYYRKNSTRYTMYKYGSGRAAKLEQLWGNKKEKSLAEQP